MRSVRINFALMEAATLAVVIVFFVIVFMTLQDAIRDDYIRSHKTEIDRIEKIVEVLIGGPAHDLEHFVTMPESAGTVAMMHEFDDLYVVGNDRKIQRILIKGGRSLIFPGYDLAASAPGAFLAGVAEGPVSRSPMFRAVENGELSVYLVHKGGQGWLVGRVGLDQFMNDLKSIAVSTESVIVFASRDGFVLAGTRAPFPLQVLPAESSGVMDLGETAYAFYRKNFAAIENDIVIFSPMAAAYVLIRTTKLIAYLALVVLVIIVALKVSWQNVLIIRPLGDFSAAIRRWKIEGGLPSIPEKFLRYQEIRDLESAFRHSAGIIREYVDMINRSRAALEESEKKYRSLVEEMRDGFFMTDTRGVITFANGALANMFGLPAPEDMTGRGFSRFFDETGTEEAVARFAAFVAGGLDTDFMAELLGRRPDNTTFFFELKASAVNAGGVMKGTRGIARDITERKISEDALRNAYLELEAANEELNATNEELAATLDELTRSQQDLEKNYREVRESESRFRAIFEHSLDAISVSKDGINRYVNPAHVRLFGYETAAQIEGRPVFDMIPPSEHARVREDIRRRAGGETDSLSYESKVLRADGTELFAELHVASFPLNGEMHTLAFIRDITGRKRGEEALRASLAEKETLLKELYHRTKNNMQVLISMLALQSARAADESVSRVFQETANRISSIALVHQKLYQSQNLSRIDLKDYIEELVPLLISSYGLAGGAVNQEYALESADVLIDAAIPCGLVLNELVSNTLKYAFPDGARGTLGVSLRRLPGGEIEIGFADDGVGMPPGFDFAHVKTLGIAMITTIVRHQMQGSIEFPEHDGFRCVIRFNPELYSERI
ncbi:MAG: PAS domain S-box protein [Spirochaetes bacterium]|nr:MAG: PAS domain S-box protein [Spirochaetota bacterium]